MSGISDKKLLDEALRVLGDDWTFLILRAAFYGASRFDQFQNALTISRPRLAERLKHLVDIGVLKKVLYQERPKRYAYEHTDMGHDVYPLALTLIDWANIWRPDPTGAPLPKATHLPCGHDLEWDLVCGACGEVITPGSVRETSAEGCRWKPDLATFRQRWQKSVRPPEILEGTDASIRAAKVVNDRWSPMIIDRALNGIQRFDALQRELGVSRNVLADRLSMLESEGILEKRAYQDRPVRFDYVPTPAAVDLHDSLVMMRAWAKKWLLAEQDDSHLTHIPCGSHMMPKLVCRHCREELRDEDIYDELKEAMRAEFTGEGGVGA